MSDKMIRQLKNEAIIELYYKILTICLFLKIGFFGFFSHLNFSSIHILIRTLNSVHEEYMKSTMKLLSDE